MRSVWASRFKKIITGRPTFGARQSTFPPPIHELESIFRDEELFGRLMECEAADAQRLLDSFQQLLDRADLDLPFRKDLIIAMQRLSSKSGLAPTCFMLEGVTVGQYPVFAGGVAITYKAKFRNQSVAMRDYIEHASKQFLKEATLWGQLSHPNVLTMYGIYIRGEPKARMCGIVSPWMENGDISDYLKENPAAPRVRLAMYVASGLMYLHKNDIVHGHLKCVNVLVDGAGRARLRDFSLSCISDVNIIAWGEDDFSVSKGGTFRWQAPEFLQENATNSKNSDVYAWGCVAWEIFTGRILFSDRRDPEIAHQIVLGARPARPESSSLAWKDFGLTEEIWACMEQCWEREPSQRPSAAMIVQNLNATLTTADPRPRPAASGRLDARRIKARYRELRDSMKIRQAKATTFKSFKSEPAKSDPGRLKELRKISTDIQKIRQEMSELDVPFTFKFRVFLEDLPPPVDKLMTYEWTKGKGSSVKG
ncbi:hypothetical protein DXG01_012676 [Tephrocybe rancida]|nr:hypothetical protein DXG01_012676 [Tephrocybe rancida]